MIKMNCKGYNLDGYSKIITERVEKENKCL